LSTHKSNKAKTQLDVSYKVKLIAVNPSGSIPESKRPFFPTKESKLSKK